MNVPADSKITSNATLVSATAVVVANHFNLSIFQPLWFVRHGILNEDELAQNILISPGVVVIPTERFNLTLLPERAQMQFLPSAYIDAQTELLRVVGGIVRTLPHTPYVAMGFNFDCTLAAPEGKPFADWDRRGFLVPQLRALGGLEASNARFGGYASYDILGARLKMTLLPAHTQQMLADGSQVNIKEHMLVTLNFHIDVPQPPDQEFITRVFENWERTFDHVCEVLRVLR